MTSSERRDSVDAITEQINDLFDSEELAKALNSEEFKHLLDHIPIAIIVSKFFRGDQRICYANKAFETLVGLPSASLVGKGWRSWAPSSVTTGA